MQSSPTYTIRRAARPDWGAVPTLELSHTGWLEPCPVAARAQACHDGAALHLRLEAVETPVRALLTSPLDPVCQDSCLEFFFAPRPGDERYLNFELNPLGTLYLGFGARRETRVRQLVREPERRFAIRPFSTAEGWGVEFQVPVEFLRLYFPGYALEGPAAGNFYKCGDETPRPHYLSWAPLHSPTPDFHRRADFGSLLLEP